MSVWFGLRLILIFQWTLLLLRAGDQHGFCHQATCVAKTTSLGQTPVVSTPNRSTCVELGRTEEDCEGLGQSSLEGPYVHHPYQSYNGVNGTLRQRIVEVHAVQEDQQIQLRLLPKVPTSLAGSDRSQFVDPRNVPKQSPRRQTYASNWSYEEPWEHQQWEDQWQGRQRTNSPRFRNQRSTSQRSQSRGRKGKGFGKELIPPQGQGKGKQYLQ